MTYTDTLKPDSNSSFILWWTLANIVALPILLIPQGMGEFLLGIFSVMTDGMPIGIIGYVIALIMLAVSGFFIGAWLGFWQWLVLRKQISPSSQMDFEKFDRYGNWRSLKSVNLWGNFRQSNCKSLRWHILFFLVRVYCIWNLSRSFGWYVSVVLLKAVV